MRNLISLLAVVMMAVSSAWADGTAIVKIGDTEYSDVNSFVDAFEEIKGKADVTLLADIDLGLNDDGLNNVLSNYNGSFYNITFDLNGHVFTGRLNVSGTLTIIDSSENQTGKMCCNNKSALLSCQSEHSNLTINGGTFEGGELVFAITGTHVTLNGGVFNKLHADNSDDGFRYAFALGSPENVTIAEGYEYRAKYFDPSLTAMTSEVEYSGSIVKTSAPKPLTMAHSCKCGVYTKKIDCWDAFESLVRNGGKGYLTSDLKVIYNYLNQYESDFEICLNGKKIVGDPMAASGITCEKCNVTISDCNDETLTYWKANSEDYPMFWVMTETETDKVTKGGVVNAMIKAKSVTLNGGNVVGTFRTIQSSDITMNGGRVTGCNKSFYVYDSMVMNDGIIENDYSTCVTILNTDGLFTMNGGTIRNNRGVVERNNDAEAHLLGGYIVNNISYYGDPVVMADKIVVGGDLYVAGNACGAKKDIVVADGLVELAISTEKPLTEDAHVGITVYDTDNDCIGAGLITSCDADYSSAFVSAAAKYMVAYDSATKELSLVSRIIEEPAAENNYTFSLNFSDVDASSVSYQWFKETESYRVLTEEILEDEFDCWISYTTKYKNDVWNVDDNWASWEFDTDVLTFKVTFPDGDPEDLSFPYAAREKVDEGVYVVTIWEGDLTIKTEEKYGFTCILELFETGLGAIDGQTTNRLTAGTQGDRVFCRATFNGSSVDSKNVVVDKDLESTATATGNIVKPTKSDKVIKTLKNGKFVIIKKGVTYDLSGTVIE